MIGGAISVRRYPAVGVIGRHRRIIRSVGTANRTTMSSETQSPRAQPGLSLDLRATTGVAVPAIPVAPYTPTTQKARWGTFFSRQLVRALPTRWMIYDALVAGGALACGYALSPKAGALPGVPPEALLAFMFLAIVAGNVMGLYERNVLLSGTRILTTVLASTLVAVLCLTLFFGIVIYEPIGRWILAITFGLSMAGMLALRFVGHVCSRLYKIRILFVGEDDDVSVVARHLRHGDRHHSLIGYCHGNESAARLGDVSRIAEVCDRLAIDEIIVGELYMTRRDVLDNCFEAIKGGATLIDELTFHEDIFERVPVDSIREGWFYAARIGTQRPIDTFLKRVLDIVLASALLLLSAPLMLILWLTIPLTSKGPAFYSQIRSGRFGRPFRIHKLRTMRNDAETGKAVWAQKQDPRVTILGRILRKTRIDEIPQLWNVLRGDMSLVGPRPERPDLIEEIEKTVPFYTFRHSMRPGLTGLAQIRYPYGASVEDARTKLEHDLYYIKKFSVLLDVQILLRTITTIMMGSR